MAKTVSCLLHHQKPLKTLPKTLCKTYVLNDKVHASNIKHSKAKETILEQAQTLLEMTRFYQNQPLIAHCLSPRIGLPVWRTEGKKVRVSSATMALENTEHFAPGNTVDLCDTVRVPQDNTDLRGSQSLLR